jgi:hypothetical protein
MRNFGVRCGYGMDSKFPKKTGAESRSSDSTAKEGSVRDRVLDAAGRAIRDAVLDHKRAGNPIAEWRDGKVVIVPPEQIED